MLFYLFSDGIIDQLGGEKHFPFGLKRLSNLLQTNCQLGFEEQKKAIDDAVLKYIGTNETQDDISLIGFRADL